MIYRLVYDIRSLRQYFETTYPEECYSDLAFRALLVDRIENIYCIPIEFAPERLRRSFMEAYGPTAIHQHPSRLDRHIWRTLALHRHLATIVLRGSLVNLQTTKTAMYLYFQE